MRTRTSQPHQAADNDKGPSPHLAGRIILRSPESLRGDPANARTHSARQLGLIAASIAEFGFINPIVIDSDGQILAGHGRHAAARQLGMSEVPTIQVEHLTPAQRRAYILADNKLAELAGWDRDLLRIQIEELDNLEFDLGLTGFSIPEIEAILEPAVAPSDDDVPEPLPGPPVSRPGDLWQLGPHKLYCGSALEVGSYEALMGSERAAVVFTDPPYNVKVKGHVSGNGKARHREFAMASGEMSKEAFTGFLRTTFRHLIAFSEEGSIHFQCIDWRHMGEMLAAGEDLYGALLNLVVWNKVNGGMGSLYRSKHELVFVYKNGKAPHRNNVELGRHGRNRTNVWDLAGQTSFHGNRDKDLAAHPTVKPVALVADALRDVSVRGDLVLDPFCGSGTTILAAERTRRQARAIELDPIYVDVAIARFEGRTGTKARLAATSQSFSEVAAARAAERAANDESGEVSHVA